MYMVDIVGNQQGNKQQDKAMEASKHPQHSLAIHGRGIWSSSPAVSVLMTLHLLH